MKKIKRVSLFFRVLFQVFFILLPIVYGYAWGVAPAPLTLLNHIFVISVVPVGLPMLHGLNIETRALGFLVTMIPVGMAMLGIYFLIRLFKLYEMGKIFELNSVRCFRSLGYVLLVSQGLCVVYDVLISLVLTWQRPVDDRVISISMSSTNLAVILAGCLLLLVSWVMLEGCKLNEEQKLIV